MAAKIFSIVVTYNGIKWIEECLKSIKNSTLESTIIVIDNNSTDATLNFIQKNFSDIILMPQSKNLGFGNGNNLGMKYALEHNADFVFLLNQDARIDSMVIETLVRKSIQQKEYGILSPIHLNWKGDDLEFGFYNKDFFKDLVLNFKKKEIYLFDGFVNASCWLLPVNTLKKVGGFDKQFFHYGEDVNYCQRVVFHGLKLALIPDVYIYHDTSNSGEIKKKSKKDQEFINLRYFKNQVLIKYGNVNTNDYKSFNRFKFKYIIKTIFLFFTLNFKTVIVNFKKIKILFSINIKKSYFQNKKVTSNYLT